MRIKPQSHTPPPTMSQTQMGPGQSTGALNGLQRASDAQTVGQEVEKSLFSRPRPMVLDAQSQPELAWLLVVLNKYRRKLAVMVGDKDEDYEIALAADTIAAIDGRGIIFMGLGFLTAFQNNLDVLVGAMAHEIGHRPKRLRELTQTLPEGTTPQQMQALLLHEEIRADTFAGHALAELGMSVEPLVAFLMATQTHPHPEYLPAQDRANVLRNGFARRSFRAQSRKKLFPEYDRHTAMRNHLGEF